MLSRGYNGVRLYPCPGEKQLQDYTPYSANFKVTDAPKRGTPGKYPIMSNLELSLRMDNFSS